MHDRSLPDIGPIGIEPLSQLIEPTDWRGPSWLFPFRLDRR